MTQDLLKAATKALSESGHEQQGARFTRERLMASLHEKNRRKKSHFAVLLPLAAIFVGSTAFAAVSGKLDVFVMSMLEVVGVPAAEAPVEAKHTDPPPVRARTPHVLPRAASQAPAVEPTLSEPEPEEEATSVNTTPKVANDVAGSRVAGGERAVTPDADAAQNLYRQAHNAHFKTGDLSQALAGYDAYLAQKPNGRFAVDARYNRALCLVRLGRSGEARPVLEQFAAGSFGGYRRDDARKLLGAIDSASAAGTL